MKSKLIPINSQSSLGSLECAPYANFTPLSIEDVKTEEDQFNMGCYFKCPLMDYGAYVNNTLFLNKAVESESARHAVSDCYEGKVFNGSDCKPFYEIWECFEVEFKNVNIAVADVQAAKDYCRKELKVQEVPDNHTFVSYEEKLDHGCFVRCVNIEMKVLDKHVFDPHNLLKSFTFALRRMVIERMNKCHEETNLKFDESDRYTCWYFFEYNECNERGDV